MINYICDEAIAVITAGLSGSYTSTNITSMGVAIQSGNHNNNVGQSAVILNSGDFTLNAQAFNKTQSKLGRRF